MLYCHKITKPSFTPQSGIPLLEMLPDNVSVKKYWFSPIFTENLHSHFNKKKRNTTEMLVSASFSPSKWPWPWYLQRWVAVPQPAPSSFISIISLPGAVSPLLITISCNHCSLTNWLLAALTHSCLIYFRQRHKNPEKFEKLLKPCHVGIHWIALAEYFQMSTHLPGFQWFSGFFASFCIYQISHQQHKG